MDRRTFLKGIGVLVGLLAAGLRVKQSRVRFMMQRCILTPHTDLRPVTMPPYKWKLQIDGHDGLLMAVEVPTGDGDYRAFQHRYPRPGETFMVMARHRELLITGEDADALEQAFMADTTLHQQLLTEWRGVDEAIVEVSDDSEFSKLAIKAHSHRIVREGQFRSLIGLAPEEWPGVQSPTFYLNKPLVLFRADFGWLRGKQFNHVILTDEAIEQAFDALDGAPVYTGYPLCDDERLGTAMVIKGMGSPYDVLFFSEHDLTGLYPALNLSAIAKPGHPIMVGEVTEASIFLTDQPNHSQLYRFNGVVSPGRLDWTRIDGGMA